MTRSTCCNAPCTYQGNRLITDPITDKLKLADIYTCDGCGQPCEIEDTETAEDRDELRGEYWLESERNGDGHAQ